MEGFRRVDEWHLIAREVKDFDEVFLKNEGAIERLGQDRLTRDELSVLELALGVAPQDDPHFDPGAPPEVVEARDRRERADIHIDLFELYDSLGEEEKAASELARARELDPESDRLPDLEG